MAIAARQTRVAVGEDHAVRVDRQVVIDPRTGRAAEVENVTVAVDMGDGNIAVARQQKITGYQGEGYGATPVYRQPRPAVTYPSGEPEDGRISHLTHCIICIFCPWWIVIWLLYCCAYGC